MRAYPERLIPIIALRGEYHRRHFSSAMFDIKSLFTVISWKLGISMQASPIVCRFITAKESGPKSTTLPPIATFTESPNLPSITVAEL
jgi:hypothetical protein